MKSRVTLELSAREFDIMKIALTNLYHKNTANLSKDIPHGFAVKLLDENKVLSEMIRDLSGFSQDTGEEESKTTNKTKKQTVSWKANR